MAKSRFIMTIPGCKGSGCPFFIDNRKQATYVPRAKGRTLYPGERYCLYGKRAKRFLESVKECPSWCPLRSRHPIVRIYTRREKTYFEERFEIGVVRPEPKDYRLCRITNATTTPLQFSNRVRNRSTDLYELLGWYPKVYDVIEMDVGLTQFYIWLSEDGWKQVYSFQSEESDRGVIGDFQLIPHQDIDPQRYCPDNATFREYCLGYATGYFAGGVFRSNWTDNRADTSSEGCRDQLESLLFVLQTNGFLKSLEVLEDYCWSRWWARFRDLNDLGSDGQYGFYVHCEQYHYYLCLAPSEDSAWNIRVFVYPVKQYPQGG